LEGELGGGERWERLAARGGMVAEVIGAGGKEHAMLAGGEA
jgi:hypothetical protein